MAKSLFETIWKEFDFYRGIQIWRTGLVEPIYATSIAMVVKASLKLEDIHSYVDEYYKARLN